jgi:toxin ParE1/3/4
MSEARFTPAAMHDLADILEYISVDNEAKGLEVLDALFRQAELLAASPGLGRTRDQDLGVGIRSYPVGRYTIFYRIDGGIEVLRVFHGARDLPNLFDT